MSLYRRRERAHSVIAVKLTGRHDHDGLLKPRAGVRRLAWSGSRQSSNLSVLTPAASDAAIMLRHFPYHAHDEGRYSRF